MSVSSQNSPRPSNKSRSSQRTEDTRESILRAAEWRFAAKGYHPTRLEDIAEDVGVKTNESEMDRENLVDLFLANTQRAKESLRVLEEVLKLFDAELSRKFKKFRFKVYEVEKKAVKELESFSK